MSFFKNKFAGKCSKCAAKVPAYGGVCYRDKDSGKFACGCPECFPEQWAVFVAKEAAEAAAVEAKLAAAEKSKLERIAEKEALIAKLGIELDKPFDSKYSQQAWCDVSIWKVPFNGMETSLSEVQKAVSTPAQSLYGALRASNGVNVAEVNFEGKYIVLSESVSLCD